MTEPRRALDGYGPEDMAIPEWKMVQKTGGDFAKELGAKQGQFHNTVTDEIADELTIVVVDVLTGRARWGEEITDSGPVCASLDAKSNISLDGVDCSNCEYRLDTPWSVDAPERRKMCCLNYTILAINMKDYSPAIIRGHGISALPVRQLITQIKTNRKLHGEYHRAVVNVKSQEKQTKYGSAYSLHPRIVDYVSDESKANELKGESNRLLGTPIPLPLGRPEDEEPVAYTPEGEPVYDQEVKVNIEEMGKSAEGVKAIGPVAAVKAGPPKATKTEEKTPKEPLDLDF